MKLKSFQLLAVLAALALVVFTPMQAAAAALPLRKLNLPALF